MSKKLFKAIKNHATYEKVNKIVQKYPKAVKGKDKYGYLPLHYALRGKASNEIIMMIFNANPKAVTVKNFFGSLPLHVALYCKYSNEIIKMIFEANPEATEVKDKYGWLPLQYALWFEASNEIITMIFEANPEATKVQDKGGSLPLHYALDNKHSDEIITMILHANPEATKVQDSDGYLPLHYAIYSNASDDIIRIIIEAYPEAITVPNKYGNLPIDFYKGDNSDIRNMLTRSSQNNQQQLEQLIKDPVEYNNSVLLSSPYINNNSKTPHAEVPLNEPNNTNSSPKQLQDNIGYDDSTHKTHKTFPILQQLEHVYYFATRISQETAEFLHGPLGKSFSPQVIPFQEYPQILRLTGTLPYSNSGHDATVQIIFLPNYPESPPICSLQPDPCIVVTESHPWVKSDGSIVLNYLKDWAANNGGTLVDLVRTLVRYSLYQCYFHGEEANHSLILFLSLVFV
jgi:ankyrin repeat protein